MRLDMRYLDPLHEYDVSWSGGLPAVEQWRTGAVYDQ